jgi:hypothetical protein
LNDYADQMKCNTIIPPDKPGDKSGVYSNEGNSPEEPDYQEKRLAAKQAIYPVTING